MYFLTLLSINKLYTSVQEEEKTFNNKNPYGPRHLASGKTRHHFDLGDLSNIVFLMLLDIQRLCEMSEMAFFGLRTPLPTRIRIIACAILM